MTKNFSNHRRVMLIDLYERPYSPEAPKSRAFIDKIFSLSGPDGGVVGGEDGISTQRPLKDGGREAWDMIRRLRQKAWQRAGLNPQKLWTEKAQMQAGLAPVDEHGLTEPYRSSNAVGSSTPSTNSRHTQRDSSKPFNDVTRSQVLPPNASSLKSSPLRHQIPLSAPALAPDTPPTPPISYSPTNPNRLFDTTLTDTHLSTPDGLSQLQNTTLPFMDATSPSTKPIGVSTPPSMVDPNLNFDWDQWDAVFGHHLPVSDELMELDPVTGFEFGDLGNAGVGLGGGG